MSPNIARKRQGIVGEIEFEKEVHNTNPQQWAAYDNCILIPSDWVFLSVSGPLERKTTISLNIEKSAKTPNQHRKLSKQPSMLLRVDR